MTFPAEATAEMKIFSEINIKNVNLLKFCVNFVNLNQKQKLWQMKLKKVENIISLALNQGI